MNKYLKSKLNKTTTILLAISLSSLSLVACGSEEIDTEEQILTITMNMPMEELMGSYEATLLAGQSADTKAMTAEFLEEAYGITSGMYIEIQGRIPSDEQWCDEYIFVKAREGQSDAIVDGINSRIAFLISDEAGLSEEHLLQVESYELYVREGYIAFSFGLNSQSAIEYFKDAFIEE